MNAIVLLPILSLFCDSFRGRAVLQLELLALRHQLATIERASPRPSLRLADRLLWVILSRILPNWREVLVIVKPETVVGWHRKGFRLYWTWKSRRRRDGRPTVPREVRDLIRRMSRENPLWGAPRIHGELLKLGIEVSQATVSKYIKNLPRPPSQTWLTFLRNHIHCSASMDFFVLPTATFRLLFVLIVLHHERRRIVHIGVTAHPTATWIKQQMTEAFPWDTAPRYMIRDRDGVYGLEVRARIKAMGIDEVLTAPRSPWQNPYVERVIGSIRRECLDHVIVLSERHLRRVLHSYLDYYHESRTHLSLNKDSPVPRPIQPAETGKVIAFPQVGGLHHRYERLAA
jgi:transposase InsO family protein